MRASVLDMLTDHPVAALLRGARQDGEVVDPIAGMLQVMRAEAAYILSRFGDATAARQLEQSADAWEALIRQIPDLPLTYQEAVQLSIWEYGTLKNKVSAGEIVNVGTRAEPRVRLGALPLCPEKAPFVHAVVALDRLRAVRTGGRGQGTDPSLSDRVQRVRRQMNANR